MKQSLAAWKTALRQLSLSQHHHATRSLRLCLAWITLLSFSPPGQGAEISLVDGFYRTENFDGGLTISRLNTGAQYSKQFHPLMYWFAGGGLMITSHSDSGTIKAASQTGLQAYGGTRYYFDRLGERFSPFAEVSLGLENKWGQYFAGASSIDLQSRSGLFYSSAIGIRMSLSREFFLDLSGQLFRSHLFSKESRTTKTQTASTETNKKENGLYLDTRTSLSEFNFAVGMRL